MGAIVVVAGDYVADYLLADINFPVGVVTGAFGAPFLLWLLARGRTGRRVVHDRSGRQARPPEPRADPATPPARLVADRVSLGYGERTVVAELTVRVPDDQVTVIVGPNACGKSTLLRGMARLLRPTVAARCCSTARPSTGSRPGRWRAPSACCPQNPVAPEGVTVVDLVGRGRHPHQGAFRRWSREDEPPSPRRWS